MSCHLNHVPNQLIDKSHDHKRCLIMSCNSAVWYAHTVEELVIWTVEGEYGKLQLQHIASQLAIVMITQLTIDVSFVDCSFEEFIRNNEPLAAESTYVIYVYSPMDPSQGCPTGDNMYYMLLEWLPVKLAIQCFLFLPMFNANIFADYYSNTLYQLGIHQSNFLFSSIHCSFPCSGDTITD